MRGELAQESVTPVRSDRRRYGRPVLVGRDAEIERVGAVLDVLRIGGAGHLLVTGEAGIGKSALLAAAVDAAVDMLVLRARGIETDGAISGAVLSEILGSPARLRPELEAAWVTVPDRLRRALVAARDLHPFAGDRFAVVAAWAALLAAASETQPVLVVLDDAQWCDAASLEAILFTARRLHGVPVCTLLAVREPPELSEVFDGLDRLVLRRLGLAASRVLATRGGVVSAEVVAAAAGNPLALVELGREPASGPHDVAGRLFGSRVASLTPEGRRALLGAALAGPVGVDVLGSVASPGAVAELERVGLGSVESGVLELVHPLVGSLIRDQAHASEERGVHVALADALPTGPRRIRHRAFAAQQTDLKLADQVESLGLGTPPSIWALTRAADLTPPGRLRDRRYLAAAQAAFDMREIAVGRAALDQVSPDDDAGLVAAALRARFELVDGAKVDGARSLLRVARRTSRSDPAHAVGLFVTASIELAAFASTEEARAAVDEALGLVGDDPVLRFQVDFAEAEVLGASGAFVEAQHAFRDLAERSDTEETVHADRAARLMLVEAMYDGGLVSRGRQVAQTAARDARASGALGELHLALACLFSIEQVAARFDAALDAASEELELAGGLGRTSERREALGHVAWCDSAKGREADCRRHLGERQALSERMGLGPTPHPALGLLQLGLGDARGAAATLAATEEHELHEGRRPAGGLRPCAMDLVEALIVSGERERAEAVLDAFEDDARLMGRPLGIALAARGRGLLTSNEEADAAFAESLRWELLEPSPFERARSQLSWGEHLRRRRAKGEATEHLEAARAAFAESGADLWVIRAERELAANGERVQPHRHGTRDELTSQERRIADLVSRGLSNREVASQMFLSVNTIETHLRHIFRKLGVRSRTQLAARLHGNP
jgi:DNA-binding CsgD family transcriptional regulator